jgi:hypothetical protein
MSSQIYDRKIHSGAETTPEWPGKYRKKSCYCISAVLNVRNTGEVLGETKHIMACKLLLLFLQNGLVLVKFEP